MKRILVSMLSLLMLFSVVSVKAQDLKTVNFSADKTEIKKGEEVKLTIASNELTGIEGTLKYDSSVWTVSNKTSQNSFTINEETGKFALANLSGEENITATLTFKSKENTTLDSSTISISKITGSDKSGVEYNMSDKDVTIKFKKENNTNNNTNNNQTGTTPNNTAPNNTTSQSGNKVTETTNNNSNTQALPDTGAESTIIGIAILGILSGIFYVRYKKYNF